MNDESKTKHSEIGRRLCRHGKIARLPHAVREELNLRLQDGESGKGLVAWLNGLPEAKAALRREFGGCAINEQNLSDWKQGGFRDWVAKREAEELMDDTLAECRGLKKDGRNRTRGSRRNSREKAVETESLSDRVAAWFFPHYVAAARGQLSAAQTPMERWSVLRTICADLAGLRRSDHHVERLRICQQKLRLETEEDQKITENEVVEWVQAHPDIEQKIWPDREWLTDEEKEECTDQILGITRPLKTAVPCDDGSGATVGAAAPVREGDSAEAKNQGESS